VGPYKSSPVQIISVLRKQMSCFIVLGIVSALREYIGLSSKVSRFREKFKKNLKIFLKKIFVENWFFSSSHNFFIFDATAWRLILA